MSVLQEATEVNRHKLPSGRKHPSGIHTLNDDRKSPEHEGSASGMIANNVRRHPSRIKNAAPIAIA